MQKVLLFFVAMGLSICLYAQSGQGKQTSEKEYMEINPFKGQEGVFSNVEQFPMYPGGEKGIAEHIRKTVKYPEEARKKGVSGTVIVAYMIETDGSIGSTNIVQSVDPLLDAEAIRVIKSMELWKPAVQKGKPTRMLFQQAITFK